MLSAALAFATTSAASHWIIFLLNGRSALRALPWEDAEYPQRSQILFCSSIARRSRAVPHSVRVFPGGCWECTYCARKTKQPKTETPGLKVTVLCLSHARVSRHCATSVTSYHMLRNHHEYVLAARHAPIAALAVPVSVFVRMPVGMIPVVIRVHRRPISSTHRRAPSPVHDFSSVRFLERCGHGPEREYQ